MAPQRKSAPGRRGPSDEDPERTTGTVAKGRNPLADADPEVSNDTIAKAKNPLPDEDPEQSNKTNARARPPPAPKRRAPTRGPVAPEDLNDGDPSYSTGQNYQAVEDEGGGDVEADAASISLDGEGLDALDPELAPKTKALQALKRPDPEAGSDDDDDDANATRAGPPIKLEIIGGPDSGKKRKFKGVRMVIGRTPGVDLQLSDQSVSRRHIELVHSDGGTLLRDLGSGNGTKLNGVKIAADTMLNHGDEIQIGKTKIRFVDEIAAFKKAREEAEKKKAEEEKPAEEEAKAEGEEASDGEGADEAKAEGDADAEEGGEEEGGDAAEKSKAEKGPRDRSKPVRTSRHDPSETGLAARFKAMNPKVRLGLIGGTVLLLVFLVIGIATRKPPPPPVDPRSEQGALKMQEARTAVKEGRYDEAVKLADEAERLSPGIDKTKLGLQAREAVKIQNNLDQARRFIADRRFEDARKLLADTPKGAARTEQERSKLEDELTASQITYQKEKVLEFLAAGELDAAKQLLEKIPPDQLGDLPDQVAEFERTVQASQQQEKKEQAIAAANANLSKKARREEEIAQAFAVVERKFSGGEWERAAAECSRVIDAFSGDKEIIARAKSLGAAIPAFGRNYDEGMKKFRQGQLTQAARPLRLAYQSYRTMGLGQNRFGEDLRESLLKAALAAGKESLIREDFENAMANFREAARIEPGNPEARKGVDSVAEKAEDIYGMGYVMKDRDPREALRKFKLVIAITEPGSPVHERAKNQVAAMAP